MTVYWLRLEGRGYLTYQNETSYDINEIKDFLSVEEAEEFKVKNFPDSEVWEVSFSRCSSPADKD